MQVRKERFERLAAANHVALGLDQVKPVAVVDLALNPETTAQDLDGGFAKLFASKLGLLVSSRHGRKASPRTGHQDQA
jgi:hypothetical protein